MTMQNEKITIALNKLDRDPLNVRKTYTKEGIEELAANIREDGYRLLQDPVVRKGDKKGRYYLTAGARRLAAPQYLAEQGEFSISLAENLFRQEMNPVDQYEAFSAMAEKGLPVADIAARFSVTVAVVRQRMALAKASPVLLEHYRNEDMTYEQLSAFTICADHQRQEEIWNSLFYWNNNAHSIRRMLTEDMIDSSDDRIKFIGGMAAYEAEGGAAKRDLFSDDGGYVTDTALVELMIATKMDAIAESVRAEGWQWVECCREMPDNLRRMHRYYPEAVELSAEDQGRLDALKAEHDELLEQFDDNEQPDAAERQQSAEVERQIYELIEKKEAYSDEAKQKAGAFIYLDRWYSLRIEHGFVKLEPNNDDSDAAEDALTVEETKKVEKRNDEPPATVIEDLTAQKTAALRCELEGNLHIALVAVVHSLLLQTAYGDWWTVVAAHL